MENFIFCAVLIWNNHHKFLVHELNFKTKYNTDIKFKRLWHISNDRNKLYNKTTSIQNIKDSKPSDKKNGT